MDLLQTVIERWGFPVGFAVWLMMSVTRELREIRLTLQKLTVVNAVILKTLDVPEPASLAVGTADEKDKTQEA
jgi:hypothetical protein